MRIQVRPLLTIGVTHSYYAGTCRDFAFVTPASTAHALRGGRTLARICDGRLHVLFEADESGAPIISLAGQTLHFGMQLVNPWFDNFTTPVVSDPKLLPIYANSGNPTTLDPPDGILLTAGLHAHTPKLIERPLTLRLTDRAGAIVAAQTLGAGIAAGNFDLRNLADGAYRIDEIVGGTVNATVRIHVSAELRNAGVWGLFAIQIQQAFYAAEATFEVNFTARQEKLKYFVVGRKFSPEEFAQFNVLDDGFRDEERSEVKFDKVRPADENPSDFPPALLGDAASPVVMFRSKTPITRRERGLRRLQLGRDDEVLVENLPYPGIDRPQAQFIICLTKP